MDGWTCCETLPLRYSIGFFFGHTFLVIFLSYLEIFEKCLLYHFWLYLTTLWPVGHTFFIILNIFQKRLSYLSLSYLFFGMTKLICMTQNNSKPKSETTTTSYPLMTSMALNFVYYVTLLPYGGIAAWVSIMLRYIY